MNRPRNELVLRLPPALRWQTKPDVGFVGATPVVGAERCAILGDDGMVCLSCATGTVLWRKPYARAGGFDLCGVDGGPVAVQRDGRERLARAYDWDGVERWVVSLGAGAGSKSVHGAGDRLLAIHKELADPSQSSCLVIDGYDGTVRAEIPDIKFLPQLAGELIVYALAISSAAPEASRAIAGLYVQPIGGGSARRLVADSPTTFAVHGNTAVVDSWDYLTARGELIGVDLSTGEELWRRAGGSNIALGLAEGVVAAVIASGDGEARPALIDLATGEARWEAADPVPMEDAALTVCANCVLVTVDGSKLLTYARETGALLDEREHLSSTGIGMTASPFGLIDVGMDGVVCLAGET